MKKQMIKISSLLFVMVAMMLSACDDYLDDVPKGQKIPKTWEDYNAFIRNNFSYHFLDPDQLAVLAGDIFKLPSAVTSPSLTRANYYADESVNRIDLMTGNDKNPYFNAYEGLFAWNLIVEDVPDATECTEVQRRQLIAQGRVLRAMHYFYLANFYAEKHGIMEPVKENGGRSGYKAAEMNPANHADDIEVERYEHQKSGSSGSRCGRLLCYLGAFGPQGH